MKTYKIHYSLFIKAEKYHYSELVENCQCGECPSYIKKSDLYFMEEGSQYFCNISKKKLIVYDKESAIDCFISWFLHGNEIMEEFENLIPIQQQKFYDENFMSISEKEFPNGFKELEFQIDNVEVL